MPSSDDNFQQRLGLLNRIMILWILPEARELYETCYGGGMMDRMP
jgi:hypothetical protein